jgi:hypothetical protein
MNAMAMLATVMLTAAARAAEKAPEKADLITAKDVEKVNALQVHAVPKNQATGAGGELNFADEKDKLALMVMIQPKSMFDFWKKQYGTQGEPVKDLGTEAFRSKTGDFISYVVFLKGDTGVWIQSMGWTKEGKARFTAAQLEALAKVAASRQP